MSTIFKRAGLVAVTAAGSLLLTSLPAAANPATLYSPTPLNGWGQSGTAYAVEIVNNTVYVGGNFTNAVRFTLSEPRSNMMAIDLATANTQQGLTSFAPKVNGTVRAIVSDGTYLYIGGDFTEVNDQPRSRVAKLDLNGNLVPQSLFDVTSPKPVRDLLLVGSTLYLVGDFTKIKTTTRRRAAAVNKDSGALLAFDPNLGNKAYTLAWNPAQNSIYVGGNFTTVAGAARNYLAAVDPVSGGLKGPAFVGVGDVILDLSVKDDDGTQLFGAGGGGFNSVVAWNASTGQRLWVNRANGDVQAVKYSDRNLYFGFHDGFGGNTTLRVLAVNTDPASLSTPVGGVEPAFQPVSGGATGVMALEADAGHLVAVGKFPKMGGIKVKGVSIHP